MYAFALRIVKLYKYLVCEKKEYVLSKQLLRSGTSNGALVKEGEHAQSKTDFLNKMNVAFKEANETQYWIELLRDSDYLSYEESLSIYDNSNKLIRLLASIVKSTKLALGKKVGSIES
ncbi:MAG TPA: four helix bundle protein [Dysgonamonadaceae bacterium]|nr:four helix bundle protein [Dysgonamonadaceae bacterium]